jgi:anti-anti-sigma factor
MITISIKIEEENMVAIMDGRLDTPSTPDAEKALRPLFHCDDMDIIFDCKKLDYISSSGLRLLMAINQQCTANHCNLYIKGLQEKVLDVFTTTGFVHLFEFI